MLTALRGLSHVNAIAASMVFFKYTSGQKNESTLILLLSN